MLFTTIKKWTKANSETCPVINIREFDTTSQTGLLKEQLDALQMFTSNYRMSNDCMDWNLWNGCVFVDIDTKKYTGFKSATMKWDMVENIVVEQLKLNYYQNFLFEQRSFSGNSFHIVFYFNCPKNADNFQKAAMFSQNIIRRIFQSIDLGDVIEWPGVLDTCGNKPCQALFMSVYPINFIDENITIQPFYGEYDFSNISIIKKEIEFKNSDIKFLNNECSIKNIEKFADAAWPHENRLRLIIVLYNFFNGNKDAAWNIYKDIIPYMVKNGNEHNESTLTRLFNSQFSKVGKYNMNKSMLDFCKANLGIKYNCAKVFEPRIIQNCNYDKELFIEGHLSSVINDIINESTKNIIHIEAGCGLGKTYSADIFANSLNNTCSTNLDDLFNISTKKRICFITPMTSINKDNFDKEEYAERWKVIDGDHKDNKNYIKSDFNICTTWDSFIKNDLAEENFEYFMFDEIHSLYMYDYRTHVISEIKKQIENIANTHNKKVVLFTGTPSLEIDDFDSYNVKVDKKLVPVNCNVIFYNDQYTGWLCEDIKKWLQEPNHRIAIFNDKSNYDEMQKLILRGVPVQFLFNKQIDDDVQFANTNHDMNGNVGMFSVYGQAGINLYSNSPVRIYVLSDNAMSIIQYANRFRNREMIESVNIVYKKENITNNIIVEEQMNSLYVKDLVDKVNKIYSATDFNKNLFLIKNTMGLINEYLDSVNGIKILNEDRYKAWSLIQKTNKYEKQMQVIYNRLINNYYNVNFSYLDDDVKDAWKSKYKGHFAGAILEATKNIDNIIKWSSKNNHYYIEIDNDKNLKKNLVGEMKSNIEYIFNSLYSLSDATEVKDRKNYMFNTWSNFLANCISHKDTITKSDIKNFCDILHIAKHFNDFKDNYVLYQIIKKRNTDGGKLTATSLMQIAAGYTTLFKIKELTVDECKLFADQSYTNIKHLDNIIDDYSWFINWDDVKANATVIDHNKIDMEFNQIIINYLNGKHTRGNAGGKTNAAKKVNYKGIEYNSVTEMAQKLNISRVTANKWLKM